MKELRVHSLNYKSLVIIGAVLCPDVLVQPSVTLDGRPMKAACVFTLRFFLYFIVQHWNRATCSVCAIFAGELT